MRKVGGGGVSRVKVSRVEREKHVCGRRVRGGMWVWRIRGVRVGGCEGKF